MSPSPGDRLGPYQILAPLGAGGMGVVYRARDTRLGREVAVKILPVSFSSDPDRLRRFAEEARAAGLLNHPNVLAIYDVGETEGAPYLVSELLEGSTLRQRLAEESLTARKSLEYAVQIANGLAAAHERGIVHRDLKPENLFVTADGRVKILDFGLAKLTGAEAASGAGTSVPTAASGTESGVVLGTAGYMSPEQVRGQRADPRSDIFAFGAVLYELFSGHRAFSGVSPADTMTAILREDPPAMEEAPGVSGALERIVRRCLEKSPAERFQSARDLGFALSALSGSAPAVSVATPGRRRRPVWSFAVPALAAAFVAGWLLRPALLRDSAPAFSRVVRLTSGPGQKFGPVLSPDGKWFAYLSDARGPVDVWVKFLAGGEPADLTAQSGLQVQASSAIGALEISPDGASVLFDGAPAGARANEFETWAVPAPLGGAPRRFLPGGHAVRFSPDGRRIVFVRAGATRGDALWTADADGGNTMEVLKARAGFHAHWPAWSADGKFLYFIYGVATFNTEPSEIFRVSASGGEPEAVVRTSRCAVYPAPLPDGRGLLYAANPDTADLALWWRPLFGGEPRRVTTGIGNYEQERVSDDGRSLVATLVEPRQSLVSVPVRFDAPPGTRVLTDGSTGDLDPALSPRSATLVFSSARSGDRNLWVAAPDGSGARSLTAGNAIDERPAFSPDGGQVAFVSSRGGRRGIWVVPTDGGAARRIATAQVLDTLSWAPDGREILFAAPNGDLPGLFRVSVSDGRVTRLVTPAGAHSPAWSPRGDLIAYLELETSQGTRLRLLDPAGRPVRRDLPDAGPQLGNGFLAWAPDGKRIAAIRASGVAESVVWIVEPGAPEPYRRLITLPVGARVRGAAWTADGASLLLGEYLSPSEVVLFSRNP